MDSFLVSALSNAAYSLPELLACGIGLAMLWTSAQAGKPRKLGLAGMGLMLACALLQLGMGFYQTWLIHDLQGDAATDLSRMMGVVSGVRLLVNCVSLAGLLMLVWALCHATRARRDPPAP